MENRFEELDALASCARLHHSGSGDTRLTWRIWGAGSPVMLLHGSAGSWTHWLRNISALAARHTVLVPDLPGFGDSNVLSGPATFENMAHALWFGLDELLPGRAPVGIAGFSFGSVVAECMALARNGQVHSLVLIRGSFNDRTPKPPAAAMKWRHITDAAELASVQRHNLSVLMFHDSERIDEQAVAMHVSNSAHAVADVNAFFPSRPSGALERIRARVCGIAGEFDCFGMPDVASQGESLLQQRPDARFHLVPGAGHWAMYERAEIVNPILIEAFSRQTDSRSAAI